MQHLPAPTTAPEDILSAYSEKGYSDLGIDMNFFSSKTKAWQVEDIHWGIVLAHITGNATFQLCQPSPRWISFKECWDESLQAIWESSHSNPSQWHFLLIENYNIALPECWGMPLWNIVMGKTTLLPCAKNPQYPENLRIIVSPAATESEDNSHLGLPTKVSKWLEKYKCNEGKESGLGFFFPYFKKDAKEINETHFIPIKINNYEC